ncbi:MAG: NAD-dependent epimerase/dehydratase family protein [Hyphomicrobiales bacterium]
MKVLVTGSAGMVGAAAVKELHRAGHAVVEFDVRDGQDVLDPGSLRGRMSGCDAVLHSAALLGAAGETPERIMEVNLQGTWNVLCAVTELGVRRVGFVSSVDALGVFKGERAPDYLPIDENHLCYPRTPYGISKYLAERICRLASASGAFSVVCLRPPGVWSEETYGWIQAQRARRTEFEWDPFWEYGAFIDVRDLARACVRAVTCELDGFACVTVASADITTSGRTSRQLAEFVHPTVEWRGGAEYDEDPYRTLLDIERARAVLAWTPRHSWRSFVERDA